MSANEVCNVKFEVLPGLPPYGEQALSFTPDESPFFSEGLVIRFEYNCSAWTGNFKRGGYQLDKILPHPDGKQVVICAGGEGYLVDPRSRKMTGKFGGCLHFLEIVPELSMVIAGDLTCFTAFRADGSTWVSPRLSWDGIREVSIEGTKLHGEAYSPLDDSWHKFTLDLIHGTSKDSVYEEQIARFVPVVRKTE